MKKSGKLIVMLFMIITISSMWKIETKAAIKLPQDTRKVSLRVEYYKLDTRHRETLDRTYSYSRDFCTQFTINTSIADGYYRFHQTVNGNAYPLSSSISVFLQRDTVVKIMQAPLHDTIYVNYYLLSDDGSGQYNYVYGATYYEYTGEYMSIPLNAYRESGAYISRISTSDGSSVPIGNSYFFKVRHNVSIYVYLDREVKDKEPPIITGNPQFVSKSMVNTGQVTKEYILKRIKAEDKVDGVISNSNMSVTGDIFNNDGNIKTDIEEGAYTVKVLASDEAGNEAIKDIVINVVGTKANIVSKGVRLKGYKRISSEQLFEKINVESIKGIDAKIRKLLMSIFN